MNNRTSSLQQYINLVDEQIHLDGSNDRLATMLNEADERLSHLNATWNSLMAQHELIEDAIYAVDEQARRLDAFVDDALYSGDAETARRCAERASALKAQLDRVILSYKDNRTQAAAISNELHQLKHAA
jgi:phage shock protein A